MIIEDSFTRWRASEYVLRMKTPETEPNEISIIRSKSPDYGAESCVPDVTLRQALTSKPKKGRRSKDNKSETVTDTTGQLQVIRKSQSTLRTPWRGECLKLSHSKVDSSWPVYYNQNGLFFGGACGCT